MKPTFIDTKEELLIDRVLDVFLKNGIKTITMDDVAVLLHVSKKTLYKYVKNRPELVYKAALLQTWKDRVNIRAIVELGLNAIEENMAIAEYTVKVLTNMNPQVHYDLYHHFPKAAFLFDEYKSTFLTQIVEENIIKGKKEGLYRSDTNEQIQSRMYNHKIDMVFNGQLFPADKFPFVEVFNSFMTHHMRGMSTEKGIELLEKLNDKLCK